MEDPSFKLKEQAQVICTELFNLGEHSMFLSVNATNQTSTILGSSQGMVFLQSRLDIIEQFYKYCSGQQMSVDNKQDAATMTDNLEQDLSISQPNSDNLADNDKIVKSKGCNSSSSHLNNREAPTCDAQNLNTGKETVGVNDNNNENEIDEKTCKKESNNETDKMFNKKTPTSVVRNKPSERAARNNSSERDIPKSEKVKSDLEVSYSDDKENLSEDQSESEDQSSTWKGRLTRKRKPSAIVLEAQSEKGYTKITVTRHKNKMDKDTVDIPSQRLETKTVKNAKTAITKTTDNEAKAGTTKSTKAKEVLKNTKMTVSKPIKQEVKEETFDIYVSGEKMFEGITEMNNDTKQKLVTDIKVEGTEETGYFVDFEKFDERRIPRIKKRRELSEHKLSTEPEVYERSSDGGFICNYCGKICSTKTWLRRHRRTHTNERPHKCEDCGKTYRQYGHLLKHKISHNPEHRPHMCDICGKTFSYIDSLKSHKKLHLDLPPCKCPDCGRTFARMQLLKQHLAFKKQGYDFMCEICGNTYRQKDTLRRHLLTHDSNREPTFQCQYCDKKFFRKSTFNVHVNNHLGVHKYVCSCCDAVFSSSATLNKHVKRKAGLLSNCKQRPRRKNKKDIEQGQQEVELQEVVVQQEVVEQVVPITLPNGDAATVTAYIENFDTSEVYPIAVEEGEREGIIYVIDATELANHTSIVTTSTE